MRLCQVVRYMSGYHSEQITKVMQNFRPES